MQVLNNQHNTTGQAAPAHIVALAKKVNRLNLLKEHGFVEQNNIAAYQHKLANNNLARLCRKARTLANRARAFNKMLDRCVGLA